MLDSRISFPIAGVTGAATLMAASAPSPLYPVYQNLWHLSTLTLATVFAVYVLALLAALLTLGSLSDRIGRRPVVSGALVLLGVGMLIFASAGDAGGLMAARIVQGFAVGAATSTITALLLDLAPKPRVGALVSSCVPALGIGAGAVFAGGLVEFAPLPRQLVFWILAAVYLMLAVLIWFVPERGRANSAPRESIWRSLRPSAALPPETRPTFFALVPSIGATWALAGLYLSLGSSMLRTFFDVQNHFVVGAVLGVFFASGGLGVLVSTTLGLRQRERFSYASLVVGVLMTVAAIPSAALALYVGGSILAGLGFGAAFRFTVDALGDVAPAGQRGEVFATMYIVSYLAFSLPALAAGLAVGRFGLSSTAVAYGMVIVALGLAAAVAGAVRTRRQVT